MQLSVTPHITIYGDVKPSEVKKPSYIREKLGLLPDLGNTKEKAVVEIKSGLMKPLEVRADLMKASG
jgi:hypothetical protein